MFAFSTVKQGDCVVFINKDHFIFVGRIERVWEGFCVLLLADQSEVIAQFIHERFLPYVPNPGLWAWQGENMLTYTRRHLAGNWIHIQRPDSKMNTF